MPKFTWCMNMSFFKKFKDKLTAPNVNISLILKQAGVSLGENLEGTLAVIANEEFDANEVRCEINCVEEAKIRKRVYDSNLRREVERDVQESATLFSAKPNVAGAMHFTKGYVKEYPISVSIPIGGRPTYQSIDRRVAWTLKGVVAVDGRPDATSRVTEVQVSQPSASPIIKEREVIREVVMIPCRYCAALMPQTETACPQCGARRTV